jgi:hypothetical protein
MADPILLRDVDADGCRYSADMGARSVRIIRNDLTPGHRVRTDFVLPMDALNVLLASWIVDRNANGDILKREVLDALEDLCRHYELDIERERRAIYPVERRQHHEKALATVHQKSAEADELCTRFQRALVFVLEGR